jgi:hypothetical protein
MEILEAQQKKLRLETRIKELINQFEIETSLLIQDIRLEHVTYFNGYRVAAVTLSVYLKDEGRLVR